MKLSEEIRLVTRDVAIVNLRSTLAAIADKVEALEAIEKRVKGAAKTKVKGKIGEVCMVAISHDYCGKRVAIVPIEEVGE